MRFNAVASRPTSVCTAAGSTATMDVGIVTAPRSSSRFATSRAAVDTRDSGASWRRMITMPSAIATASAMPATMPKIATTESIVESTPDIGSPETTAAMPVRDGRATTR